MSSYVPWADRNFWDRFASPEWVLSESSKSNLDRRSIYIRNALARAEFQRDQLSAKLICAEHTIEEHKALINLHEKQRDQLSAKLICAEHTIEEHKALINLHEKQRDQLSANAIRAEHTIEEHKALTNLQEKHIEALAAAKSDYRSNLDKLLTTLEGAEKANTGTWNVSCRPQKPRERHCGASLARY